MRLLAITFLLLMAGLAGCVDDDDSNPNADDETVMASSDLLILPNLENLTASGQPLMTFTESIVDAAIGYAGDLYEPTMEVSDTGAIYVTGHTIGVDTTGAPVFGSYDDGASWEQLPFTSTLTMPADIHGATPPISDEIFLVAGDDGYLYGVDITAFAFPVNAWANDGGEHVYYNPNAYDRVSAVADPLCSASSLNDRPWSAYGNGKLLMVNNPGGGPMEIGVMDVPVEQPLDVPGNPVIGPEWNLCASSGGWIPGIPDMRDDHFFAVPQVAGPNGDSLHIVKGDVNDIMNVEQVDVMEFTTIGPGTSNYGHVAFDEAGTMFITVRNNTAHEVQNDEGVYVMAPDMGQIKVAVSLDDGTTFVERTLRMTAPVTSVYMDGNMDGEGVLLTWAQQGTDGTDWYAAHLFADAMGHPYLENISLVVDEGPAPSAHVQGAAAGPDGRAHIVTFHGGYGPLDGATPLHVWIQEDGPTLPVSAMATAAVAVA